MERLNAEAKVGIFVFMGLILLVYMSLKVGGLTIGREKGYDLYVSFENATGLDENASVYIAGVKVGRVKAIALENNKARMVLRIIPEVGIGKDFMAALRSKGLLGEKYVELIPGSPDAPLLADGDEIINVERHQDIDKLVGTLSSVADDIKQISQSLSNVLGGEEGEATLRNIVYNIEDMTAKLDRMITVNDEKLSTAMNNMAEFSKTMKEVAASINTIIEGNQGDIRNGIADLRSAAAKLEDAMDKLDKIAPEIKETVASIKNVAGKIDKGDGTIGKLINSSDIHDNINKTLGGISSYMERAERFRTYVGYRAEYLFSPSDTKHYVTLRLQPKADKYYLIEVIDDPRGKVNHKSYYIAPNPPIEITTTSDSIKVSAEVAKRFGNVVVRGGLIESTGGAGIDYYLLSDRVKVSFEAFDFDKERKPHLKAGAMIFLNRYFFVSGGIDDFANKDTRSSYAGVGFQFEDEDLKFLFSSSPPIKP
ncbi:MAG: MlaD family protein [Deltaproteobacteria bacterium]|nr:MlaD family protein [Deltaproteobacteria bacterium]